EFLIAFSLFSREIVSTTSDESMIDPSTMASGERRSIPSLASSKPPFFSFSSTNLTAEEPISRPTTFLLFEKNTAHPIHLTHFSLAPDVKDQESGAISRFRGLAVAQSRSASLRDRATSRPRHLTRWRVEH